MRALLFDLDDTLVPEEPAIVAGYEAVAERVWGAATIERVRQLRDAAHAVWCAGAPREYAQRVHFSLAEGLHGDLTAVGPEPDRMRAFIPRLHAQAFEAVLPEAQRGTSTELVGVWREARMAALAPYPETHEVLSALRGRFALGIVTNGAERLQRAKLERTGLDGCFDVVVVSEMVGVGKPSPEPFAVALRELDVHRDETAMVGNDTSRDIAGARAAGIRPVWVHRPADGWGDGIDPGDVERIGDLTELLCLPEIARHRAAGR
ncbi:MAG TPA: HAD family hydrolase [Solirubrobacteraceae bacterium]|nr:HAD family hydrolase [Solirubrobacteraceae bacterium]